MGAAALHSQLLRTLPIGAALQVMMTILPARSAPGWEALREGVSSPMVESQRQLIRAGAPYKPGIHRAGLRRVETLVTFALPLGKAWANTDRLLRLCRGSRVDNQAIQRVLFEHAPVLAEEWQGTCDSLSATLHDVGHGVERLDGQAIMEALWQSIDPMGDKPPAFNPGVPLAEQVATRYLTTDSTGCWWEQDGEPWGAQVLSLQRLPPKTYPGLLCAPRAPQGGEPVALWEAWDGPMRVVVNVASVDQGELLAKLKRKRSMAWMQRLNPLGAASIENQKMEEELSDLLENSYLTRDPVHWMRGHVVLWGEKARLRRGVDDVRRTLRRVNAEFFHETVLASTLFFQSLPLGFNPAYPSEKILRRAHDVPGLQIANLMPLYGGFRGSKTPSIFYMNQRGEIAAFSPFDDPTAPHVLIPGTSGAGKSFSLAYWLDQVLAIGGRAVVLDRLPSYKELCAAHGGHYVEMDYNHPVTFNPFYGPLDKTHQAFITAILAEMASGGEKLRQEELGVLADAVGFFLGDWDKARGEPTLSIFAEEVLKEGAFARADARAKAIARSIGRRMNMFYGRGAYAGFVDGPNTFRIEKALTVVELSRLKEAKDLQAVILFALMHLVTQFYSDPALEQVDKYFCSDETWALLKHEATAGVLEDISRTFRKLRTSAIFMSQLGRDFDTPAGQVLLTNAPTRLFLRQDPQEISKMQTLFELGEAEVQALRKARRWDGGSSAYLHLSSQQGGMVHLIPPRLFHALVAQGPGERHARQRLVERYHGDWQQVVAHLAEEGGGDA